MIRHQADNDRLVCIFRRNCPNHANISFSNIAVDIIQNRTRFHILGIYYEKYKSIYRISYLEKIISATIELTTHSLSQHLSQHSLWYNHFSALFPLAWEKLSMHMARISFLSGAIKQQLQASLYPHQPVWWIWNCDNPLMIDNDMQSSSWIRCEYLPLCVLGPTNGFSPRGIFDQTRPEWIKGENVTLCKKSMDQKMCAKLCTHQLSVNVGEFPRWHGMVGMSIPIWAIWGDKNMTKWYIEVRIPTSWLVFGDLKLLRKYNYLKCW
jgi:hypothetical protein